MKMFILLAVLVLVTPSTFARHDEGCVPTQAHPSTLILIPTPDGRLFYWEERDNPLGTSPPVPLSGFILGGGTWIWEEVNTVEGLQRGGVGFFPQCLPPPPLFPLICSIEDDPIVDVHCGHGPDQLYF